MKPAPLKVETGKLFKIGHRALVSKAMADGDPVVGLAEELLVLHHAAPFSQPPEMPNGACSARFFRMVRPMPRGRFTAIVMPENMAMGMEKVIAVGKGADGHGIFVGKIDARIIGHLPAVFTESK